MDNRQQPQNGYVDILQHILLLIFTFGIYQYYWIYKTTKLLNFYSQEQRNEVTELLLCIFVPFYFIYWYYKTADIIEKVDYQNPNKDFKTLCIIFAIFIPIVSAIFVQDRLNKMFGAPVYTQQPANPYYQQNAQFTQPQGQQFAQQPPVQPQTQAQPTYAAPQQQYAPQQPQEQPQPQQPPVQQPPQQ